MKKILDSYEDFKSQCSEQILAQGRDNKIIKLIREWRDAIRPHQYTYHFEALGRPVIQHPQDMIAMQELIWRVKPDLIIETGIAHGGSLIQSAAMLALLDICEAIESGITLHPGVSQRKVLGIDIDIRAHNREAIERHPMASRIHMIQGSSVAPEIVESVRQEALRYDRIMVSLDSNHTHEHVLAELQAYAPLVSIGSYCVVCDTVIEDSSVDSSIGRPWGPGNNPKTAVMQYIKTHPEFEIDESIQNKLLITDAPDGYLRRLS